MNYLVAYAFSRRRSSSVERQLVPVAQALACPQQTSLGYKGKYVKAWATNKCMK